MSHGFSTVTLSKHPSYLSTTYALTHPPTHPPVCVVALAFSDRAQACGQSIALGFPVDKDRSPGYSAAHMVLFVSEDGAVLHSGEVFKAVGHLSRCRALSKGSQIISSLPKCRAFSCDHSVSGRC